MILLAVVACGLGGILKGATGAGAPIIGVPVLAALVDVQFAVAVYIVPNLATNVWQIWQFRSDLKDRAFLLLFAGMAIIGGLFGTYLLVGLPSDVLMLAMALVVLFYVLFRIFNPQWTLSKPMALRLAGPAGFIGGVLQGSTGLSAPASLTFLNAVRLPRGQFIATISLFFCTLSLAQFAGLLSYGVLGTEKLVLGLIATLATLAFMPVGDWLARQLSREVFDRLILGLLLVLALKTLADVFL
ncbi:MAG: sulfite exporter TauE/SafE family protein [Rhodobacteraceae bacterium]|nr:sulfite exporter TauE/SafE family protein [Paracoccaceae bacterium]